MYTLWDRRPKIKWIAMAAFGVQTAVTTVFSILAAQQMQREQFLFVLIPRFKVVFYSANVIYLELTHMCAITEKPWALPGAPLGKSRGIRLTTTSDDGNASKSVGSLPAHRRQAGNGPTFPLGFIYSPFFSKIIGCIRVVHYTYDYYKCSRQAVPKAGRRCQLATARRGGYVHCMFRIFFKTILTPP